MDLDTSNKFGAFRVRLFSFCGGFSASLSSLCSNSKPRKPFREMPTPSSSSSQLQVTFSPSLQVTQVTAGKDTFHPGGRWSGGMHTGGLEKRWSLLHIHRREEKTRLSHHPSAGCSQRNSPSCAQCRCKSWSYSRKKECRERRPSRRYIIGASTCSVWGQKQRSFKNTSPWRCGSGGY